MSITGVVASPSLHFPSSATLPMEMPKRPTGEGSRAQGFLVEGLRKQEMYKLHKENPEVYNVERLAKDFRIMRQRVHVILWLKEDEEEMEKRMEHPLNDVVDQLLDTCPELCKSADHELHVAELPLRPDFKVMLEDGTAKDPDEKLWEISQREDEMLYQEFVQCTNSNKAQIVEEDDVVDALKYGLDNDLISQ